jgi:REP element-mobilizing transposase RayT
MRQARIRGEGLSYYHCLSRVVDRRFIFGNEEREFIVALMRKLDAFLGVRVVTYAVMSNHFHLLVEEPDREQLPPLDRDTLLRRLGFLYDRFTVEAVREELDRATATGNGVWEAQILARYERRMGDVSIFMKELKQRFTQWYNRRMGRKGTLWEERFKSVIVESGVAARTMAAYIDLNPVRAGMVKDPADYRWSSYGEAIGGGNKGNGRKAREGLVRACLSHRGAGFEIERWKDAAQTYRQLMGLALQRKSGHANLTAAQHTLKAKVKGEIGTTAKDNGTVLPELGLATMLRCKIRYFSDGAVIGSKAFVNEAFTASRERFSAKRKDGARRMKGSAATANGLLWTVRDLRFRIN